MKSEVAQLVEYLDRRGVPAGTLLERVLSLTYLVLCPLRWQTGT